MSKRSVTFFNLWILLSGLLAYGPVSHSSYDQLLSKYLADSKYIEYNHIAPKDDSFYASELDAMGITFHSGAGLSSQGNGSSKTDNSSLTHCKSLVYRTLKSLPSDTVSMLRNLTFDFNSDARRGLGGGSTVIIRCGGMTDNELVSVMVHEMGHVADTGVIQGSAFSGASAFRDGKNLIFKDDPSVEFYRLSFKDEKALKADSKPQDFVSGYAMSDVFEDFAETYDFYVLHGNEFRVLKATNQVLDKKYEYLKTRVFDGKEFFNGNSLEKAKVSERNYDTTVLPYDLETFLVS